jgi:hypothetical protein
MSRILYPGLERVTHLGKRISPLPGRRSTTGEKRLADRSGRWDCQLVPNRASPSG